MYSYRTMECVKQTSIPSNVITCIKSSKIDAPSNTLIEYKVEDNTDTEKVVSPSSKVPYLAHTDKNIQEYVAQLERAYATKSKFPSAMPSGGFHSFITQVDPITPSRNTKISWKNFTHEMSQPGQKHWSATRSIDGSLTAYNGGAVYFSIYIKNYALLMWNIESYTHYDVNDELWTACHPRYDAGDGWSDKHIKRSIITFSGDPHVFRNFAVNKHVYNSKPPYALIGSNHIQNTSVKFIKIDPTTSTLGQYGEFSGSTRGGIGYTPDIFNISSDWTKRSGWVYAMTTLAHRWDPENYDTSTRGIKIGLTTVNVFGRKKQLQTDNERKLTVITTIYTSNPTAVERYLHRMYTTASKRLSGEWFYITWPETVSMFKHIDTVINA